MTQAAIDRAGVEALVPHAGSMCLLDGVRRWDEGFVLCHSRSHLDPRNPLRGGSGLAGIHAVEYAAQATAVHGGLLRPPGGRRAAPGVLAAVRDLVLAVSRLDEVEATLEVEARRLVVVGGSLLYEFDVSAARRHLARGRLTIVAAPRRPR